MTSPSGILTLILAGISLVAFVQHLIIGFRKNFGLSHIYFAFFTLCVMIFLSSVMLSAKDTDPQMFLIYYKIALVFSQVSVLFLVLFVESYLEKRIAIFRKIVFVVFCLSLLIHIIKKYGILMDSLGDLDVIVNIWGENFYQFFILKQPGRFAALYSFYLLLANSYILILSIRALKKGKIRESFLMFAAILFFIAGILFDYLFIMKIFPILPLSGYSVITFIILMSAELLKNVMRSVRIESEAQKLHEINTIKSRFFASISHELRTPLSLISGPVDRLISQNVDKNHQEDLKRIRENAAQMNKLVEMYLDLSRLESGKLIPQKKIYDILFLLRIVISSFESRAQAESKSLILYSKVGNAICKIDKEMFALIMNNLLSNAFKFTPQGGQVVVTLSQSASQLKERKVSVSITDTGIGITADKIDRIFDMYFQLDNEINKRISGTGIGLAVVMELVKMNEGEIHVESTVGRGSIFTLEFPVVGIKKSGGSMEPEIAIVPSNKDIKAPALNMETVEPERELILIVEDNQQMLDYIKSYVDMEYKSEIAPNGMLGFESALNMEPQLVISDVMMPEMDGFEFCAKLKNDIRTSHIPVILLTAKIQEEDMFRGLETGADAYLKKPFNAKQLLIHIRNLLDNRRRLQENIKAGNGIKLKDQIITSADQRFLEQCQQTVEKNLSNENFSVDMFASEMAFSRTQLHRKLKALTGLSASGFIRTFRLKKAALLLKKGFGNIAEVAYECGFANPSYFTEAFKEMYQVRPTEFADKHKM